MIGLFIGMAAAATFSHTDPACPQWQMDSGGAITCKQGLPPPNCSSLSATPPVQGITTITAHCSGQIDAYTWSAAPAPVSGFYEVTSVQDVSQRPTITASTTFSVQAWNNSGGSNIVSAPVGVTASGCSGYSTVPVSMAWDAPQRTYTGNVTPSQIIVAQFTVGAMTPGRTYGSISASNYGSPETRREAFLSANPCDFSTPPALGWNAASYGTVPYITFMLGNGDASAVGLQAGVTYYMSIKTTGPCTTCNMAVDLIK